MSDTTTTPVRSPALDEMVEALRLGREAVMESFDHAQSRDDTYLAEARLRDIDDALSHAEAAIASAPPSVEGWQGAPGEEACRRAIYAELRIVDCHGEPFIPAECITNAARAVRDLLSAAPAPPQKGETSAAAVWRDALDAASDYVQRIGSYGCESLAADIRDLPPPPALASPPSPAPLDVRADMLAALEEVIGEFGEDLTTKQRSYIVDQVGRRSRAKGGV